MPITIATTGLLLAGNLALGLAMAAVTGAGLTTMTLSTSPGGLAEMSLTAVALKADVSLVTAFHLVRTLVVAGYERTFVCRLDPAVAEEHCSVTGTLRERRWHVALRVPHVSKLQ